MVEDWGTARERQRTRRRWALVAVAILAVMLAPLAATFLLGVVEGFTGAHDATRAIATRDHAGYVGTAIAMVAALTINLRLWRNADEVERQQVTAAVAIAGVMALVSLPVLALAQRPLGLQHSAMIGWGLAIGTMVGVRIIQRLRG